MALLMIAPAIYSTPVGDGSSSAGTGLSVIILMPTRGNYTYGDEVPFAGMPRSASNRSCNRCSYEWISSIDGIIGRGVGFSVKNLSVGSHAIEFKVKDEYGVTASATKNIIIKPAPLNARIVSPKPEKIYTEGEVPLDSTVSGGVAPYTHTWRSDEEALANDKEYMARFTAGNYSLKLEVRDSAGSYAVDTAYLAVVTKESPVAQHLSIEIEYPRNYEKTKEGASVSFEAEVSGGTKPYSYTWSSDEGVLGNKDEFILSNLSKPAGEWKTINLKVYDANGDYDSESVMIGFYQVCNKDGVCYTNAHTKAGEDYLNCPQDCPSGSPDGYCDKVKDARCDPDCKWLEDPDCVCNLDGLCDLGVENYANCLQDCPSGSEDGYCDKVKDARCDPDCKKGEDSDCTRNDSYEYFILIVLILVLLTVYLRLRRRML